MNEQPRYSTEKLSVLQEGIRNLLLIAPPGCGKTEALALRAKGLIEQALIAPPKKVLALAFSNRARDNIGNRIEAAVGSVMYRRMVDLTNFHGFSARVYQAHARTIGLNPEAKMPDKGWLRYALSSLGLSYSQMQEVEQALCRVKLNPLSDEEVIAELEKTGPEAALQVERERQREGRLDYGDLLRHAQRILGNPNIARLYQLHYGAILVDEFQDLTLQQFSIAYAISQDNLTFAGDPDQAIFSFTGADPKAVEGRIRQLKDLKVIEFRESFRSSPSVLRVMGALGDEMGVPSIQSADPSEWYGGGFSAACSLPTYAAEADFVVRLARLVHEHAPSDSIGIVSRAAYRRRDLDDAVKAANLPFPVYFWDNPVHRPEILHLLRAEAERLEPGESNHKARLDQLEQRAATSLHPADVDSLDEVREACRYIAELIHEGYSLEDALASISASGSPERVIGPGLHILNAHVGKGQQFDWVVILGLEDGHVPSFLAESPEEIAEEHRTLLVMVTRARHGVVLTRSEIQRTRYGPRQTTPSPWWPVAAQACDFNDRDVLAVLERHLVERKASGL